MLSQMLQEWVTKHNAYERALEMFWYYFEGWSKEKPKQFEDTFPNGFEKEKLSLCWIKFSYEVDFPDFEQPLVFITMDMEYDDESIGWFKQYFMFDGQDFNEYFVIQ